MASVHGPHIPRNHSPFRRVHRTNYSLQHKPTSSASAAAAAASSSAASHTHHSSADTFYGHEETAKICSRYVAHTFNCPEILPPPQPQPPVAASGSAAAPAQAPPQPPAPSNVPGTLAHFVAYALHRTRLHASVTFTALALLHRLKTRFPAARGSSGHRLFLSAFMIASKVVCDDTYSNKSWAVVGQGMFALREINQMEREMCAYLEWQLNVPGEDLSLFEAEVRRIYSRPAPYAHGVTISLVAGVGGAQAPCASQSLSTLPPISIPGSSAALSEKQGKQVLSPSHMQQLPTPTENGPVSAPFGAVAVKPILPPITTGVASKAAYLTPPTSPPSPTTISDCSASPADTRCAAGAGSPSTVSSVDSDLPTPPNSAGAAQPYSCAQGAKMQKSFSLPGYAAGFGGAPHVPVSIQVHRASVPPPAKEALVSSVSASHAAAEFRGVGSYGAEDDGDAVMAAALDDEKRHGTAYYATVHRPAAGREWREKAAVRERERSRVEGVREREKERDRKERDGKERRGFRTYTVPCSW
ncbi:hypothetical protein M0805_009553 [Coniferiporia weirii]|nr:hypothetical protein M0805_009553 [Coniferiporia weirii]